MKKLILCASIVATMAGCSSLNGDNVKLSQADKLSLCDVAYNGVDASTKARAQLEIEMRGGSWKTGKCKLFAENENRRRAASGGNDYVIIVHEPDHWKKQDEWEKANKGTKIDNGGLPAENDSGEIDIQDAAKKVSETLSGLFGGDE